MARLHNVVEVGFDPRTLRPQAERLTTSLLCLPLTIQVADSYSIPHYGPVFHDALDCSVSV